MNPPGLIYRVFRNICSYAAPFGLIQRSSKFRPQGISAMIRVKNAIDWIEACIRSIDKLADEIVVVDNGSTDGSYELIKKLENEINKLRLFSFPDATLVDLSNYALNLTRYQWVIKWDADFIAHTNGDSDIRKLRKFILSLNPHYYYCIYLRPVHLFGDFEHVFKPRGFLWIDSLHTYSPKVKYILKEGIERLKVPKYFRIITYDDYCLFHINIKPISQMLLRHFLTDWQIPENINNFKNLEDYTFYRVTNDWKCKNLREAEKYYIQNIILKYITKFDETKYGKYPDLLKIIVEKSKYKIVYKNGKPVNRIDT